VGVYNNQGEGVVGWTTNLSLCWYRNMCFQDATDAQKVVAMMGSPRPRPVVQKKAALHLLYSSS